MEATPPWITRVPLPPAPGGATSRYVGKARISATSVGQMVDPYVFRPQTTHILTVMGTGYALARRGLNATRRTR